MVEREHFHSAVVAVSRAYSLLKPPSLPQVEVDLALDFACDCGVCRLIHISQMPPKHPSIRSDCDGHDIELLRMLTLRTVGPTYVEGKPGEPCGGEPAGVFPPQGTVKASGATPSAPLRIACVLYLCVTEFKQR